MNIVENNKIYLGLGSNLGDRLDYIERALDGISDLGKIVQKSDIYETEPVGYKDQGDFLNMVIEFQTPLSPFALLSELQRIESKLGRDRANEKRFGPRVIDIDILLFNDEVVDTEILKIPHPRMHERNFVLIPLRQISPNYGQSKNRKTN